MFVLLLLISVMAPEERETHIPLVFAPKPIGLHCRIPEL